MCHATLGGRKPDIDSGYVTVETHRGCLTRFPSFLSVIPIVNGREEESVWLVSVSKVKDDVLIHW